MKNKYMDNEDGSAGGIFTLVSIFLLAGFLFVVNGFVLDQLTLMANSGMFATTAASQLRYDVFNLIIMVFRFQPIIVLIALGINQLMSSNMQFSETTPLSSLAFGVIELEFITTIIMAVAMFAGYGLDTVVSTVSTTGIGASATMGTSGFTLIQLIPNVFYGTMLIIIIGATIQFVLECVQVSDHSNSFTQSN